MRLVANEAVRLKAGRYQYLVNVTSGDVTFQISADEGATFQDMTNGNFTTTEDGIMLIARHFFRYTSTGVSTVDIDYVGY